MSAPRRAAVMAAVLAAGSALLAAGVVAAHAVRAGRKWGRQEPG